METAGIFSSVLHPLLAVWQLFARAAAPAVVTALWQGAAVALGLAVCLRMAPRIPAAQRFAAWAAGFAVLLALPLLPTFTHFLMVAAPSGAAGVLPAVPAHPLLQLNLRLGMALGALWALATAVRGVDLAMHSLRLRRLWKNAIPVEDSRLSVDLHTTGMGGRKPVELCTTQELDRPSVIGFVAPRILIPDWLMARLTPGELDQIVLHETEHLRRRDDWTNLLQKIVLVLFPLNPALWWMERRLCQEREMACDEGVIRVTRAPRAYAACLTTLAERGLEKRVLEKRVLERRAAALSLGAWQRRPELVHRVHSILRRKHALHPLVAHAVLAVMGGGLVFGSMELARCPQLVAFVPAHQSSPTAERATASPQATPARLQPVTLRTAHVRHAGPATVRKPVQAEALVARMDAPAGAGQASQPRAWDVMDSDSAAGALRQQALRAETTLATAAPLAEPQWIVLTAWEQVETTGEQPAQTASVSTPQGHGNAGKPMARNVNSAQPGRQGAREITVTRLILRVYPANSISNRQALAALHSGWLVLQL